MAATETKTALARKLALAREEGPQTGSGRSVLRALRLALARTAAQVFDLPLAVIGATQTRAGHGGLHRHLPDDRLLMLLDGPDGQTGAMCLDIQCVSALVRQQTMGQVTGAAADSRAFTGTDAALAAPLVDAMLARAADLAESPADKHCLSGYRFGARAEDKRSLLLAMEAEEYRVFDLTIEFVAGTVQGAACLVLPDVPNAPDQRAPGDLASATAGHSLDRSFDVIRADLAAVVCRLTMPLAQFSALRAGDVVPITRRCLERTELLTIEGQATVVGRLGQVGGMRALRVNETIPMIDPEQSPPPHDFEDAVSTPMPDPADPLTVEAVAASSDPGTMPVLPAPRGGIEHAAPDTPDDDEKSDDDLLLMTPNQVAVEISELAGLPLVDIEED